MHTPLRIAFVAHGFLPDVGGSRGELTLWHPFRVASGAS